MTQIMEKFLRENLNIPSAEELQIQRAHRAFSSPPPDGSQPRSILVKFLCLTVREEVLKLAWQKKGFSWNNNRISLDYDYPPEIMAMRREYADVRRILKENNLRFWTIYPAHLKVFYEDDMKIYNTVEDTMADMATRGLPVKINRWQLSEKNDRGGRRGGGWEEARAAEVQVTWRGCKYSDGELLEAKCLRSGLHVEI